jgi:recombination protein RecT
MSVRNAVAEIEKPGVGALVEKHKGDFLLVLPTHLNADQWVRVAQGVIRRDPKLARAALANPPSLLSALLRCAHLGLEPGETFHLGVFGNEIVGMTDYTGEIELMYRTGTVAKVEAQVVKDQDIFEYSPAEMTKPLHKPKWFGDRGKLIGVYAYAEFLNGAVSRVVMMGEREIAPIRAISKNKAMWDKHPDAYWLKTAIHQLRKWVPTSAEYRQEVLRAEAAARQVSEAIPDLPESSELDVLDAEIIDDDIPAEVDENGALPLEDTE